jgi:hypothetical protein
VSDVSNAAPNTPGRDVDATPVAVGVDGRRAAGKGRIIAAAAAVSALGVAWIAWRLTKASVKRHPAVRVTRAGVHAIRDR